MKLRYITGRGGSTSAGLSKYLRSQAKDFAALPVDATLLKLSIDEQITLVNEFCSTPTHLVVNSYGAYLWLLSRIDATPTNAKVLMLSPVMGRAVDTEKMIASRPPRMKGFDSAIAERRVNLPDNVSVYTGKDDSVCDFKTAVKQCKQLGITDLHILENETHNLSHGVVATLVGDFLK
jgi:hypothetical protein